MSDFLNWENFGNFPQNSLFSIAFRLSQEGLNCRLAERDTFIITIIQNAMMEGRIQKTTFQGDATVESLDPDTVTRLLHYLDLSQVNMSPLTRYKLVAAYVLLFVNLCLTCIFIRHHSGPRVHHASPKEEPSCQ